MMAPAPADDGQVLDQALAWLDDGDPVVLALVVSTWGSAPRGVGAVMAVRDDGLFAGSVSGGCVEAGVAEAAQHLVGPARLMDFAVDDATARRVGLACGGDLRVLLLRPRPDLLARLANRRGQRLASALVIDAATGTQELDEQSVAPASGWREDGRFALVAEPATVLVVVGAVHVAQALLALAAMVGYQVVVIDPRRSFATPERFPGAHLVARPPQTALEDVVLDARTGLVTLAHVADIDDAALVKALASDAFYVGALGSRRTHAKRRQRLGALGVAEAELDRIHAPVGLDIGAANPAEIAVAVLAQVIAARRGKPSQRGP